LRQIGTIEPDMPTLGAPCTDEELRQAGLPGAGGTDDAQYLARIQREGYALKNGLFDARRQPYGAIDHEIACRSGQPDWRRTLIAGAQERHQPRESLARGYETAPGADRLIDRR
jgi:hypothetical protein